MAQIYIFLFYMYFLTTGAVCRLLSPRLAENPTLASHAEIPSHNHQREDQKLLVNPWEMSGELEGDIKVKIGMRNVMPLSGWPDGIVPYTIRTSNFNQQDIQVIEEAMRTIQNAVSSANKSVTCQIKFVPREHKHANFIEIIGEKRGQCWSYVGMMGGRQELSLGKGCVTSGTVMHELIHALGLHHQHSSHDRDDHIRINWENIATGQENQFSKFTGSTSFGLSYDFDSIMHYSAFAFARVGRDGKYVGPTMSPRDPGVKIKRNKHISETDKEKLQRMYCSSRKYGRGGALRNK